MTSEACEIPGLELEAWLKNQIIEWENAPEDLQKDRLAEGHIRALRSVLHKLTKMDCYPDENAGLTA